MLCDGAFARKCCAFMSCDKLIIAETPAHPSATEERPNRQPIAPGVDPLSIRFHARHRSPRETISRQMSITTYGCQCQPSRGRRPRRSISRPICQVLIPASQSCWMVLLPSAHTDSVKTLRVFAGVDRKSRLSPTFRPTAGYLHRVH